MSRLARLAGALVVVAVVALAGCKERGAKPVPESERAPPEPTMPASAKDIAGDAERFQRQHEQRVDDTVEELDDAPEGAGERADEP